MPDQIQPIPELWRTPAPVVKPSSPVPTDFTRAKYGEAARDEGIDRAERGADPAWLDRAYRAAVHVCQRQAKFIVDDVWAVLDAAGVPRPREGRAIASVLRKAEEDGLCVRTADWKASAQPQCHANPRKVYRSLAVQP